MQFDSANCEGNREQVAARLRTDTFTRIRELGAQGETVNLKNRAQ